MWIHNKREATVEVIDFCRTARCRRTTESEKLSFHLMRLSIFFYFFFIWFFIFLSHWWIYVILNWIYTRMTIGQTHCGLFLIFSLQALESTSHPVGFHLESTKGESDRKMTSILNLGRRRIRERTDESKGVKRAKKYEKKEKLDSNLYRGPTFIAQQLPLFLRSWAPNLVLKVNYS